MPTMIHELYNTSTPWHPQLLRRLTRPGTPHVLRLPRELFSGQHLCVIQFHGCFVCFLRFLGFLLPPLPRPQHLCRRPDEHRLLVICIAFKYRM